MWSGAGWRWQLWGAVDRRLSASHRVPHIHVTSIRIITLMTTQVRTAAFRTATWKEHRHLRRHVAAHARRVNHARPRAYAHYCEDLRQARAVGRAIHDGRRNDFAAVISQHNLLAARPAVLVHVVNLGNRTADQTESQGADSKRRHFTLESWRTDADLGAEALKVRVVAAQRHPREAQGHLELRVGVQRGRRAAR